MAADFHVFLSHNSKDKPLVREIATRLAAAGLKPWLDVDELRPGLPWQDGLEEAMRTTGAAAVFLGGHGVGSWQKPEIRVCLSQMVERGQPVIPVLLPGAPDNLKLNLFLRENTWVDLRQGLSEEGVNRLIWGITGEKPEDGPRSNAPASFKKPEGDLAAAQRLLKERTIAGQDTEDVREQILQIRRDIRDGVRLQTGDRLGDGRFHLLEVIGRGGFATVWKAWDEEKAGLVAVKVLHGQHVEDRSRRERFFRGARRMAELHHPGIVRVIEEHLEWGGHHYFVMEHVGGGDLRQAVLAGKLPPDRVLPLILEIGEALSYAHGRGIIHRDVKPANVLLAGDQPKLTDFDLVRAFDSTGGTQTQGYLGTFLYTAPEVLENAKEAGVTADVYSLAMTAVFAFHGKDLPPDVWRRPEAFLGKLACPAGLRDVLCHGISWEPEERPGSAAELCLDLCRPAVERRSARLGDPKPGDEWTNEKDGTVLVYVPGGEYVLGSEDINDAAKPVHRVILSPFWIGKYPLTNEQYGRFLKENPEAEEPEHWDDERFNQPRQPVVGVSWDGAKAYCAWAGLQLPSEAQWEATARGTDERRYPWGNDKPTSEHASFERRDGPTQVGVFPKGGGPFGTLDQAGNVWEWCEDVWNEEAYKERDGKQNPVSTTGESVVRCLRGGSWYDSARVLAAAHRFRFKVLFPDWSVGFRCSLPVLPGHGNLTSSAV